MKVELQLEVSQQQLFDLITTSIINEIKHSTGKNITTDEINQFCYTKSITTKLGVTNSVDVVITNYTKPSIYEANVISSTGNYIFRYEIEPLDDNHCYVQYEETYSADKWNLKLNHAIFSRIYMKASKKRLIDSIRHMEQLILHPELMSKHNNDNEEANKEPEEIEDTSK